MTCARCQKKIKAGQHVHSRLTNLNYCRDFVACDRRLARRKRKVAKQEGAGAA